MAKTYASEKDVKKHVKELLTTHKYFWWMPPANGFGKVGVSDFNALRSGVFLAVETKFASNKPTPQQKAYLQSIIMEDGFGFVVSEKTLSVFQQWLEAFDRAAQATADKKPVANEDGALMLDCIAKLTADIV
jgi:hypothetical protein